MQNTELCNHHLLVGSSSGTPIYQKPHPTQPAALEESCLGSSHYLTIPEYKEEQAGINWTGQQDTFSCNIEEAIRSWGLEALGVHGTPSAMGAAGHALILH